MESKNKLFDSDDEGAATYQPEDQQPPSDQAYPYQPEAEEAPYQPEPQYQYDQPANNDDGGAYQQRENLMEGGDDIEVPEASATEVYTPAPVVESTSDLAERAEKAKKNFLKDIEEAAAPLKDVNLADAEAELENPRVSKFGVTNPIKI